MKPLAVFLSNYFSDLFWESTLISYFVAIFLIHNRMYLYLYGTAKGHIDGVLTI